MLEYDIGELEGTSIPEGEDASLGALREWITRGRLDARVPGGESGHEVSDRFRDALNTIGRKHAGGSVVVVSHVGTLTIGMLGLCDDLGSDDVWGHPLPNAQPLTVVLTDRRWSCSSCVAPPALRGVGVKAGPGLAARLEEAAVLAVHTCWWPFAATVRSAGTEVLRWAGAHLATSFQPVAPPGGFEPLTLDISQDANLLDTVSATVVQQHGKRLGIAVSSRP